MSVTDVLIGFDLGRPGGDESCLASFRKLYGGGLELLRTFKPPRFRRNREVHAQRARTLRRRGEYVHFLRWEHGHCIYYWGGPIPATFYVRMPPR